MGKLESRGVGLLGRWYVKMEPWLQCELKNTGCLLVAAAYGTGVVRTGDGGVLGRSVIWTS